MIQKLRNKWREGRVRTAYLILLMVFFAGGVRAGAGMVGREARKGCVRLPVAGETQRSNGSPPLLPTRSVGVSGSH